MASDSESDTDSYELKDSEALIGGGTAASQTSGTTRRRNVKDTLLRPFRAAQKSYSKAREIKFEQEKVTSMDLEEPDLYLRRASILNGGEPPEATPGPDLLPPPSQAPEVVSGDGPHHGEHGEKDEHGHDSSDEHNGHDSKGDHGHSAAAHGSHKRKPKRTFKDHLKIFGDEAVRYIFLIFMATLVTLTFKFIFYASEQGLEWRLELMERYLGIESAEGGEGGEARRLFARAEEAGEPGAADGDGNRAVSWTTAYFVTVATSLMFALPAAFLIVFFKPAAAGAGMPEVIALLNGDIQKRSFHFSTLVLKVIGSVCIVASGLFSGFDGPVIHIGSVIAYQLIKAIWGTEGILTKTGASTGLGTAQLGVHKGLKDKKGSKEDAHNMTIGTMATRLEYDEVRDAELQKKTLDYATLGAVAAISAGFKSPLGAITFALEEAISHFDPTFISRSLVAALWAFLMLSFVDKIDWFNPYSFSVFVVNGACNVRTEYIDLALWIVMGLAAGVAGHFYNIIVTKIRVLRTRYTWPAFPWRAMGDIVLVVMITAAIVVFVPLIPQFDYCSPRTQTLQHMDLIAGSCTITCAPGKSSNVTVNPRCAFFQDRSERGDKVCVPNELHEQIYKAITMKYAYMKEVCPKTTKEVTVDPFEELTLVGMSSTSTLGYIKLGTLPDGDDPDSEPEPCYYQMRSLFWNVPEKILRNLFLRGVYGIFEWQILFIFAAIYLVISMLISGIGLPTDLVVPNLIIGASFGRLIGLGMNVAKTYLQMTPVDPGLYALLGMASFWAGTSRMSITIALIALETSFELTNVPAILTVVTVATITGNALGHSLFHMEIHARGIPYLASEPPIETKPTLSSESVKEIMSHPVAVVNGLSPTKGEIRQLLDAYPNFNGFPVVDEHGGVLGLVVRARLAALLKLDATLEDDEQVKIFTIMNPSPTVIPAITSVLKAYMVFRNNKLRHMIVVDSLATGKVVGIVTRRDLVHAEHAASGH